MNAELAVALAAGLLVGALAAWLFLRARILASAAEARASVGAELAAAQATLASKDEQLSEARAQLLAASEAGQRAGAELLGLREQQAELRTTLEKERESAEEKLQAINEARQALTDQFKVLANEILEEKSKRFAEQNIESLDNLLGPLNEKIIEFKAKVEEVYNSEGRERAGLKSQVEELFKLNKTLSGQAENLTTALKGSTKIQGDWGEMILETLLEASGIREGTGYTVQKQYEGEGGKKGKPDVILHLPKERCLVVDSKVSIEAYSRHAMHEDPVERQKALRQHIDSIRTHIDGLYKRDYQKLYGLKSTLDFVVMFIPVEPAFLLAIANDDKLFMDAWKKNVLLASPSTLLYVLRIVDYLWRQEAQARNAMDIADRGGRLYDKFVSFVEDLNSLGQSLKTVEKHYANARNKLSEGRGCLVDQAETLRELGVKASKTLSAQLVQQSRDEQPALPDATTPAEAEEQA